MNKQLISMLVLVLVNGCGSDPVPEPSAEEIACADHCSAAAELGCAGADTCEERCLSLFELGCNATLLEFMECSTPALADDCSPRDPDGAHTCGGQIGSYVNCLPADMGGFSGCGPSIGESGGIDPACVGSLECDQGSFAVECDEAGACVCRRDGEVVGECQNIMASAYLCAPHASCCTPFFTPG